MSSLLMLIALPLGACPESARALTAGNGPLSPLLSQGISQGNTFIPSGLSGVAPVEDPYVLGAGDRLRVDVFLLPQYSGEFEILVDGVVTLPIVGGVSVEGLTVEQATRRIYDQYSQILRNPRISVTVLARRALQVAVSGEVYNPGPYLLPASLSEMPTLSQVLELAGGVRMSADISQIEILRQQYPGTRSITVDLFQLLQAGDLATDITLRDGDRILVPTAETADIDVIATLSTANFATTEASAINIAIVGEVFRPGPHVVTGSAQTGSAGETGQSQNTGQLPTVTRAIQVAGGIKPLADVRAIQVRRPTRSGTDQLISVNLWELLQTGDLNQDLILQEGDTVIVPTAEEVISEDATQLASASFSPDSIRVNVVGEVEQPGVVSVAPNTPLNQGLFAAGGFNNRARRRSVELIRLNSNGTLSSRKISVDFDAGISEENNPALQNNDIILVERSSIASLSDTLGTIGEPVGRVVNLITTPFTILRLLQR
ncbi:MAG: SLBB domain-containing protein [Leptolyngbyaceae bacterium]|nr:SLBB domain-containing protein [Leptolyngbyaceae bacterium]